MRFGFGDLSPLKQEAQQPYQPWPTVSPLPDTRPSFRNLPDRPTPAFQEDVAQNISPVAGGMGAADILHGIYASVAQGDWKGVADRLPMALGIFAGMKAKSADLSAPPGAMGRTLPQAAIEQGWEPKLWYRGRYSAEGTVPEFLDPSRGGKHFGDGPYIFLSEDPRIASAYAEHHALNASLEESAARGRVAAEAYRPTLWERIFGGADRSRADAAIDAGDYRSDPYSGSMVMPLYVRPGRQAVIDVGASPGSTANKGDLATVDVRRRLRDLYESGDYDTVLVKNSGDALVGRQWAGASDEALFPNGYPSELVVFNKAHMRSPTAMFAPEASHLPNLLAGAAGVAALPGVFMDYRDRDPMRDPYAP